MLMLEFQVRPGRYVLVVLCLLMAAQPVAPAAQDVAPRPFDPVVSSLCSRCCIPKPFFLAQNPKRGCIPRPVPLRPAAVYPATAAAIPCIVPAALGIFKTPLCCLSQLN